MKRLYIETLIAADLERVWQVTQDPAAHSRWDARFHRIKYLAGTLPQRFEYVTFGVSGTGITAGEKLRTDGTRISVLRFASESPFSPIRAGAGYWRYQPAPLGVRFTTGYDYQPGWGTGPDVLVRPIMGWLTAWSFDRLRLWLEHGLSPERTRNQAIAEVVIRLGAVLAASTASGLAVLLVCAAAIAVPPLPTTPAARRCRRKPGPDGDRPPSSLNQLELS